MSGAAAEAGRQRSQLSSALGVHQKTEGDCDKGDEEGAEEAGAGAEAEAEAGAEAGAVGEGGGTGGESGGGGVGGGGGGKLRHRDLVVSSARGVRFYRVALD
jgi:hypothetical protein